MLDRTIAKGGVSLLLSPLIRLWVVNFSDSELKYDILQTFIYTYNNLYSNLCCS
jgi:hypothetical protein